DVRPTASEGRRFGHAAHDFPLWDAVRVGCLLVRVAELGLGPALHVDARGEAGDLVDNGRELCHLSSSGLDPLVRGHTAHSTPITRTTPRSTHDTYQQVVMALWTHGQPLSHHP